MTKVQLWERTIEYVRSQMPLADWETVRQVSREVYDVMKFLVDISAESESDGIRR